MAAIETSIVTGQTLCFSKVPATDTLSASQVSVACPTTFPGATSVVNAASTSSASSPSSQNPVESNQGGLFNPSGSSKPNPASGSQTEAASKPGNAASTPGIQTGISNANGSASATAPATSGKGLAGGAVAGVAIGMLLAGALIAAIVFFFLLRRQRRQNVLSATPYSRSHAPNAKRNVTPEKGATVTTASRDVFDDLLPQPVEDGAITSDLSIIRDNIKNHVRTYYHSGPISAADINEARIHGLATSTGTSAATLNSALANPTTRDNALRSIVGSVILTRCTVERSPSLLPNSLVALLASTSNSTNNGYHSQSILYSKWKVLTGVLLQQQHGRQHQDPSRAQTFEETVASLDSILAPFIKGSIDGGQRRKNLEMILARAANFAFLLFTQPGTFRFDFAAPQGSLTVSPALVQTVGDQGQPLNPIKILTEKEVVAV